MGVPLCRQKFNSIALLKPPRRSARAFLSASIIAIACADPAFAQADPTVSGQPASPNPNNNNHTLNQAVSNAGVEPKGDQIQEIVVTARKRQENVNRVGMSITAITGDALIQQGVSTPADLAKVVPGFNYTRSSYGVPVYTLRGIGYYDTSIGGSPTVSVYTDEVPLPYSAMTIGAGLDVDRVEVLKGPQGTLYGENSTGGAINYIAAKPTKFFSAGVDATYQSFNEGIAQGYVSGPLTDTLGFRISGRIDQGGAWQRSYTRHDKLGNNDQLIGRALLDWKPSSALSVELNVNGWRDKSDTQAAQFGGVDTLPPGLPPAVIANYPMPPHDNKYADWDPNVNFARNDNFYQASGRIDYHVAPHLTLTSLTAYEKYRKNELNDVDGTALPNDTVHQFGYVHSFFQELRLAGDVSSALHFVLGANYGHDSVFEEADPITPKGFSTFPFTAARSIGWTKVRREAVFADVDLKLTDTVTLQGGLRYSDSLHNYHGCTLDLGQDTSLGNLAAAAGNKLRGYVIPIGVGQCATLGPAPTFTPGMFYGRLDEHNVPWRINVNWQVTPSSLLYANVSRGYKEGGFPVSGAIFTFSLAPVVQEEVLAYEAGFKLGLADRHIQLNGAAFYYDYTNKQVRGKVADPVIGRQNKLINVPKSHAEGAEFDATLIPFRGLHINGGITYVKSKIDGSFVASDALGTAMDLGGEAFPLTPRWQVQADAEYSWPVSARLNAFVGGHYAYQSAANSGLGDVAVLRVPAYGVLDARMGVRAADDRWSLTLFARNVTNKYYWTMVSFASPDVAARYTGRPRTFGATLSFRY